LIANSVLTAEDNEAHQITEDGEEEKLRLIIPSAGKSSEINLQGEVG
jgi:hypothetical protein